MRVNFEHKSFVSRLKSMLLVDFRRMFTMPLCYIMFGISFVVPILVLVMTTMMDGSVSVDPTTGVETVMEAFDSTWQAIGSVSGVAMDMSMTGMCNINLVYFMITVLVCIFVSADFRSGYVKNLFTVRAKKTDYVISKTIVCIFSGVLMLLAFFVGAMFGGVIASLPFDMGTATASSIVMCMLAKTCLVAVFVPMYLLMSVIAKDKLWLSILLSFGIGMLLFTMIPMLTPLDASFMNVMLCFAGGVLFSFGFGIISKMVLYKKDLL